MASAILASQNESYWGERKVYMKKNSNSNPNPRLCPNPNSNPNPNPSHIPYSNVRGAYETNHRDQKEDALGTAGTVLSEDSSSFNWKPISRDVELGGASACYVSINISNLSKKGIRDLKRRLVSELEQVRSVASRIESRELQSSARSVGYSASGIYCSSREVSSPAPFQHNHLSQPESLSEMEMRVLEAKNSHLPPMPNQEMFGLAMTSTTKAAMDSKNLLSGIMKKSSQILARLMKHKGGMWFNSPVDVQGMGLHDYRLIIKHPMDLGTVRSRLKNGFYKTPLDFAEDIRLTFNNALIYNPEAHEVHKLAALLLRQFEGLFGPAYAKYEKQLASISRQAEEKQILSSWPHHVSENSMRVDSKPVLSPPAPVPAPAPAPVPQQRVHSNPVDTPSLSSPYHQQPPQKYPITARTIGSKLPKPKAKDPNKRPMSYEERQKLSFGLQSLPEEKMNQVLQIVKKRNIDTQQEGDEIVLDFEIMDTETLWELDRFVYNCKKMLSKIKRQEALTGNAVSSVPISSAIEQSLPADSNHKSPIADDPTAKRCKKGDPVDEDIDIGEEMTSTNYPSVEIEKDDGHGSSSSSSGTDSSSSSDSDSRSTSGSDSDDEDRSSPVKRSGSPPN
ncbi:transcription factor GTE7-like [Phalaenopsis equestris]|uniref:transcription factor GTE7-like n=1 Tax=Phalaenopsis equestris TaxID=78828 RepID=UPI0009E304A1|nr:transcription factor GTE7-like [Phalaenopsis equestris]XP_020572548.1 transcription factor GTE7-like [Phalaenopsis equestris]